MQESVSILVVDDDERLARTVARYLSREGYRARTAANGREMQEAIEEEPPRLVILDLMLPDADGFELARTLRARSDVGIVMLTGRTDPVDRIVGLELGADDYLTKPFDERELLARVRSVLRRVVGTLEEPAPDRGVARFGGWVLDLEAYELTSADGRPVGLSDHEFRLLAALVRHGRRVLTREAILDSIFGREWTPDDRSVDVLVAKLRRKLGDDAGSPTLIKTVRGAGYRLIPSVSFGGDESPPAAE
jgi:two-component system OmpR family response regulator